MQQPRQDLDKASSAFLSSAVLEMNACHTNLAFMDAHEIIVVTVCFYNIDRVLVYTCFIRTLIQ